MNAAGPVHPGTARAGPGTVCVTGGSGTIASHLIQHLLDQGWTVRTTVRRSPQEAALRATRYPRSKSRRSRIS